MSEAFLLENLQTLAEFSCINESLSYFSQTYGQIENNFYLPCVHCLAIAGFYLYTQSGGEVNDAFPEGAQNNMIFLLAKI